jgi:hypothetical protein
MISRSLTRWLSRDGLNASSEVCARPRRLVFGGIEKFDRQMIEAKRVQLEPHLIAFKLIAFLVGLREVAFEFYPDGFSRPSARMAALNRTECANTRLLGTCQELADICDRHS